MDWSSSEAEAVLCRVQIHKMPLQELAPLILEAGGVIQAKPEARRTRGASD